MLYTSQRAQLVRWGVALLTFAIAVISFLYGPSRLEYPAPFLVLHASAVLDSLLLAATFYASLGLILARRSAWRVAVLILTAAVLWESIEVRQTVSPLSLVPLAGLLVLLGTRHYYPIASHASVFVRTLRRALLLTGLTTGIGCLAFYTLAHIEHRSFAFVPSLIRALDQMYSFQDTFQPLRHDSLTHILGRSLLFGFGILNYSVIALALLRPVADSFELTPLVHARVLHFLHRFSTSADDYFKYFPEDKSYYFGEQTEGVVAYGLHEGICVALADPLAASARDRRTLIEEFTAYGAEHGWTVVFLGVEYPSLCLYEAAHLSTLKIGEAARVPLVTIDTLLQRKNNRNIMNRFSKAGYRAELSRGRHHPALLQELRDISDEWLSHDGRQERQFAMGYFDSRYLQRGRLFTVRDERGRIVAFANLPPNFSRYGRVTIDLMRARADAPTNTMDFLFLSLMSQLAHEGWREFDLGLAPLSGLAKSQGAERGLHLLSRYAGRLFSFTGVRRFKDKFDPDWQPMFLAHSGNATHLPRIALAINELLRRAD